MYLLKYLHRLQDSFATEPRLADRVAKGEDGVFHWLSVCFNIIVDIIRAL